jgi:hypothetical protein
MLKEQFFHVEFPHSILDEHLHINALEMLAVIACLKMWGTKFKGKRIKKFFAYIISKCHRESISAKQLSIPAI